MNLKFNQKLSQFVLDITNLESIFRSNDDPSETTYYAIKFKEEHKEILYSLRSTLITFGIEAIQNFPSLEKYSDLLEVYAVLLEWMKNLVESGLRKIVDEKLVITNGELHELSSNFDPNRFFYKILPLTYYALFGLVYDEETFGQDNSAFRCGTGTFLTYLFAFINLVKVADLTVVEKKSIIRNEFRKGKGHLFPMLGWGINAVNRIEYQFIDKSTFTFKEPVFYLEGRSILCNHSLLHQYYKKKEFEKRRICPAGEEFYGPDDTILEKVIELVLDLLPDKFFMSES